MQLSSACCTHKSSHCVLQQYGSSSHVQFCTTVSSHPASDWMSQQSPVAELPVVLAPVVETSPVLPPPETSPVLPSDPAPVTAAMQLASQAPCAISAQDAVQSKPQQATSTAHTQSTTSGSLQPGPR
jgi:hypothetical protein